jgi:hypothetical protein
MAELKTKPTSASAEKFLASVKDAKRRADSAVVLAIMKKVTGEKPRMWGSAIVGFGQYHYKSERSTQEGDWPMVGFSPRKQALTVYLMPGFQKEKALLKKLGPHSISGGSCLYIKDLSKIDQKVLTLLIKKGFEGMKKKYG